MLDRDGTDTADYASAVRRTRIMMVIALAVGLLITAGAAVAVFGVSLFLDVVEMRSR
jgi:hypothetical protein